MKIDVGDNLIIAIFLIIIGIFMTCVLPIPNSKSEDRAPPHVPSTKSRAVVYKYLGESKTEREHEELRDEFIKVFGDRGLSPEDIDEMYDDDVKKELLRHRKKTR